MFSDWGGFGTRPYDYESETPSHWRGSVNEVNGGEAHFLTNPKTIFKVNWLVAIDFRRIVGENHTYLIHHFVVHSHSQCLRDLRPSPRRRFKKRSNVKVGRNNKGGFGTRPYDCE